MRVSWTYSAAARLLEAATTVVGIPRPTSSAWEGPESMTQGFWGSSSWITSESTFRLPGSSPLETQDTTAAGPSRPAIEAQALRTATDGVATITRSASSCSGSCQVMATRSAIFTPGSRRLCSRSCNRVWISCSKGE